MKVKGTSAYSNTRLGKQRSTALIEDHNAKSGASAFQKDLRHRRERRRRNANLRNLAEDYVFVQPRRSNVKRKQR